MTPPPEAKDAQGHTSSPPPRPTHLTWADRAERIQALTVWTERRPGHGEDAEPLAVHHRPTGHGLLAVFDGSGGSGSAPAWPGPGGETYTSAWVGARAARLGTERWFHRVVANGEPDTAEQLAAHLRHTLRAARPKTRSKIVGSMRRSLPTTLAAVRYRLGEGPAVRWQAMWAGDSRSYALLPGSGLHALTRDHTTEDDTLLQLRQDPPMTNVICADRPFTVAAQPARGGGEFPLPCVLLSATDGFFGYVHTPAHFECLLLYALVESGDMEEWAACLREAVQDFTGDDASLSLVALGFEDFPQLRGAFQERYESARETYLNGVPPSGEPDDQDGLHRWQEETWQSYRSGYETYMPPPPEVRE